MSFRHSSSLNGEYIICNTQEQDEELNRLRIELRDLREDENKLEQRVESGKLQLEQLTKSQKDLSLQVNQV